MKKQSTPQTAEETILEVGAEGGSLRITRFQAVGGEWRFIVRRDESTLADLLTDEDRQGLVFVDKSGALSSFQEALKVLSKYPWYHLYPLTLHPAYRDPVLTEVRRLGGKEELERWQGLFPAVEEAAQLTQLPPAGGRMEALDAARPSGYVLKPVNLTVDEARALIDSVFRSYGLEPADCIDENGWRVLRLGEAQGFAGVVEWGTGEPYLVVFAPLRQLPGELQMAELYRTLLELNHSDTLSARFTLNGDVIFVSLTRPVRGLDAGEVDEALRAVMTVADQADQWLDKVLGHYLNQASLPAGELPNIPMTPEETLQMSSLLFACSESARPLIRVLLEKWIKSGYKFDLGVGTLHLKIPYGTRLYTLAAVRVDFGYDNPLLILGWDGLRRLPAFPEVAVGKYQAELKVLAPLAVNETTAHMQLGEDFDAKRIHALVRALDKLAKRVDHSLVVGARPVSEPNIQATLAACDPQTAEIFAFLIEEWRKTGESVLSNKVGRVGLKLKVEKGGLSSADYSPPTFTLASLVAPKKGQGPSIEVAYGLNKGEFPYLDRIAETVGAFDGLVASLPGFGQKGVITRLLLSEKFERSHAEKLLEAMKALRLAVKEA